MAIGTKQQKAAKEFAAKWKGKGFEKGESQPFWMELLQKVLLVEDPYSIISFENRVKLSNTSFIDAYIKPTHVLIEQKSIEKDLHIPIPQSDGTTLTPFRQAKRYADELPYSDRPRWIVICNFREFNIYDMENPQGEPAVLFLADLEKEYHRLSFLVDDTNVHLKKELEVSIQAGEIVGVLYEKFLAQYLHPENPDSQKSLNKLCVRLVFCLYAEDAGIFGAKNMFHDYMAQFPASEFRKALIELFQVLDTAPEDRDPYMDEKLAAFPFVSGGMFAGDIEIPRITDEIRTLILQRASDDFDWSLISPTIFGAVFESTLNPDTRRAGGMHYTSLENIHKVIDPLFLDDLKAELADIKAEKVVRAKKERAIAYQDKLSSLKFLDPACGSGNFLTESYTCLRRLENEVIKILYEDRVIGGLADPIKVSIYQFYGIEINDFACSVSQAALWIAETQMLKETDAIVGYDLEPLPLKDYHNIHEGNALRMNWNDVVPAAEVDYIMGNPPFIGKSFQTPEQKADMEKVFAGVKNYGNLDYVTSWYKKGIDYIEDNPVCEIAFVSTNSICQGIAVPPLWKHILGRGYHINFAFTTFKWNSEANEKAAVHCVILGLSRVNRQHKFIYPDGQPAIEASNINPYLMDAPSVIIEDIHDPVSMVPRTAVGSFPTDGGNLVIAADEKDSFIENEPLASPFVRLYIGPEEFINNKKRYCLWLKDCSPAELRKMPSVLKRLEGVRQYRLSSSKLQTQKRADTPHLFAEIRQPESDYLLFPRTSSERRAYLPIGFMSADVIAGDTIIVPNATIYHFGVLESVLHMAWMRAFCGRLKSDYRYSGTLIYNNFPWPTPTDTQKAKIEQTAQAILDARALYPDSSLADLYDELTMPPELRKAHRANDAAVLEAYGFPKDASESEIVARLFKMYQELTEI
jgi:type I restriction-modification system DNA methylase subunit